MTIFDDNSCDLTLETWDTYYIADNWEQQYKQLLCDLWIKSDRDSICNSCDVFFSLFTFKIHCEIDYCSCSSLSCGLVRCEPLSIAVRITKEVKKSDGWSVVMFCLWRCLYLLQQILLLYWAAVRCICTCLLSMAIVVRIALNSGRKLPQMHKIIIIIYSTECRVLKLRICRGSVVC